MQSQQITVTPFKKNVFPSIGPSKNVGLTPLSFFLSFPSWF